MSAPKLNFDKSDWTPVKFGEVAFDPKESVKDARAEGIENVVGLEHIDSEDIHLRRSNSIDESTTFTKKFSEGDILFGRRRAYLKKAAQAPFEGICSGDITVMRANEELLLPELLPFIVNNDKFFDWAVTHSAGGLSPRCKFKDLANYEFLLPPKEQQVEIAELLWAADDVIEKEKEVLKQINRSDSSQLKHYFYKYEILNRIKLKHICSIKKGRKPAVLLKESKGIPYCTSVYLRTGKIESIVPKEAWEKSVKIDEGDILILWDGSNAGEILFGKNGFLASTMCKLEITNNEFLKDFVFQFLRFKTYDLKRATVGSAIPHVDPGIVENIKILN